MGNVESCNHILLRCPIAYSLWCLLYGLMGINWVMAESVREEVWAWKGLCKSSGNFVKIIPLSIFWVLWKESNSRVFDGKGVENNKIKDRWL